MAEKRKTYTVEQKTRIVNRVLNHIGDMSVAKSCEKVRIAQSNFTRWVNALEDVEPGATFKERYARGRQNFIDKLAQEILDIADTDVSLVELKTYNKDGVLVSTKVRTDGAEIQNRRLQIDARKWLLSKIARKEYGDRLELAGDPDSPLKTEGDTTYNVVVHNYSTEEKRTIERNLSGIFDQLSKS